MSTLWVQWGQDERNAAGDAVRGGVARDAPRGGLSYRRLAKASEISHSFLSHVEKGERRAPPAKAVLALADALDADRTTFALAAIADRAGGDVATTMVMALQRGPWVATSIPRQVAC